MDPRVKTPRAELEEQFAVSETIYEEMIRATAAIHEIAVLREQMRSGSPAENEAKREGDQVKGLTAGTQGARKPAAPLGESLETDLAKIAGRAGGAEVRRGAAGAPTLASVRLQLARMENSIQNADVRPTAAQVEAHAIAAKPLPGLLAEWERIKKTELPAVNAERAKRHLAPLRIDAEGTNPVEDSIEIGDEE